MEDERPEATAACAVGDRIRRAREECGLTESALAETIGVSPVTLNFYEIGLVDAADRLGEIAEATGKPLAWFLGKDGALETAPELEPELEPEPEPKPAPARPNVPLRTSGWLVATLDLSGLEHLTGIHQLGGRSLLAETGDGRQVRISASRDPSTGEFVSGYERESLIRSEGDEYRVWELTTSYRAHSATDVEACLEAALAEVDSGERPSEPGDETAEVTGVEGAPGEEALPAVPGSAEPAPPRRWLLARLRRRRA